MEARNLLVPVMRAPGRSPELGRRFDQCKAELIYIPLDFTAINWSAKATVKVTYTTRSPHYHYDGVSTDSLGIKRPQYSPTGLVDVDKTRTEYTQDFSGLHVAADDTASAAESPRLLEILKFEHKFLSNHSAEPAPEFTSRFPEPPSPRAVTNVEMHTIVVRHVEQIEGCGEFSSTRVKVTLLDSTQSAQTERIWVPVYKFPVVLGAQCYNQYISAYDRTKALINTPANPGGQLGCILMIALPLVAIAAAIAIAR